MASRGTAEEVRRANLSAVLRLLYVNGPSSRAVLARATGRNRSTMASLVADLAELGLVEERDPDALGVAGRPSPVVHVRPEVAAIAVNPEVDALTIGLVGLDGAVRRVIRHGYDRIPSVAEVLSITSAVLAGMEVELAALRVVGIGVAVPGQVQTAEGVVRNAPHLGWRDEPFAAPLAALTGLPVSLANDAALGAMAEHRFGSGRGKDHLVYLNGGASGIGGGVIIAGALLGGTSGYAGEIGHIRIASSPALDSAGIAGTLESLVTRAELLAALGLDESSADRLAAALLHTPPQPALAVAHRQLAHLGSAIAAVINILNPQVIALGGFLAALLAFDPDLLDREVAAATLAPSREGVRIVPADLSDRLLLVGAAGLAFEPLLRDPASFAR